MPIVGPMAIIDFGQVDSSGGFLFLLLFFFVKAVEMLKKSTLRVEATNFYPKILE